MTILARETEGWDKLAPRYHAEVISPFAPDVAFRLPSDVDEVLSQWRDDDSALGRTAIDFGCGIGEGLELIAGKLGVAAGVDYSVAMLQESRRRLAQDKIEPECFTGEDALERLRIAIRECERSAQGPLRTILVQGDIGRLTPLFNSCDLAIAVNCTAPESSAKAYNMVGQIVSCLKTGGLLLAVFPSLDTMEWLAELSTRYNVCPPELGRIDENRIYVHPDGAKQKFFVPEEIVGLADENQLRIRALQKVTYPWKTIQRHGWGYFADSAELWDWYLLAAKL